MSSYASSSSFETSSLATLDTSTTNSTGASSYVCLSDMLAARGESVPWLTSEDDEDSEVEVSISKILKPQDAVCTSFAPSKCTALASLAAFEPIKPVVAASPPPPSSWTLAWLTAQNYEESIATSSAKPSSEEEEEEEEEMEMPPSFTNPFHRVRGEGESDHDELNGFFGDLEDVINAICPISKPSTSLWNRLTGW
ncbi:hypothetical protein OIO90_003435 [Microbotryomycetes sp. JL221]|nr:hypothetical protein OIO90_003435 [Microbotryomycetes sp. JL221]